MGGGEDLCDSLKRGLKGGSHSRWSAAGLEIRLWGSGFGGAEGTVRSYQLLPASLAGFQNIHSFLRNIFLNYLIPFIQ